MTARIHKLALSAVTDKQTSSQRCTLLNIICWANQKSGSSSRGGLGRSLSGLDRTGEIGHGDGKCSARNRSVISRDREGRGSARMEGTFESWLIDYRTIRFWSVYYQPKGRFGVVVWQWRAIASTAIVIDLCARG